MALPASNDLFSPLPMDTPSSASPASPPTPLTPPTSPGSRRTLPSSASSPLRLNPRGSGAVALDRGDGSASSNGGENPRSWSSHSLISRREVSSPAPLDAASLGVLDGTVGGSYGPFPRSSSYSPQYAQGEAPFNQRDSLALSNVAIDVNDPRRSARLSTMSSSSSEFDLEQKLGPDVDLLWNESNKENDDFLHESNADIERLLDKQWSRTSMRGWLNVGLLTVLIVVLIGLFGGWPVYNYVIRGGFPGGSKNLGWNLGGINGTGQVPSTGLPNLIDASTPSSVYTRTGFDGKEYDLVFSDEFNVDGRTFWPGDDPWWEAVDLHYWATDDLEWYDPDAVTTEGGNLVITLSEEPSHGLNFRSGMVQSWNKFCFTGGYVEVSMSLPGTPVAQGYWPGVWTMGNLGRAGYGATNYGVWPYSYDACDVGTMPNQTYANGTAPTAAKTSGSKDYGGELSYLPGQKLSACTCAGEDHPGPNVKTGRGAPEIDIIEAQVDYRLIGSASQSVQDAGYLWLNSTPYIEIYNTTGTFQNTWHGSVNQESLSIITLADKTSYEGAGYINYGFEYTPGPSGRVTWAMNQTKTWQLNSDAIGPNADAEISQRTISEEPMSINLNLAISTKFQYPEWGKLTFPGKFRIDYVRVYQTGKPNVGCDPASHPTSDYIERHGAAYNNANYTTWLDVPGETWPKNSMSVGGCNNS